MRPDVVISSGMTEDGYIPVDSATLATRYPGVYAVGDVATAGVPKAGVFAEGAARVVAQTIAYQLRGGQPPDRHLGRGTCYIEFGHGTYRQRRHRLPVRSDQNGHVQRAFSGADGTKGAIWLEPPRSLVRRVTTNSTIRLRSAHGHGVGTIGEAMRAIQFDSFGGPEVLVSVHVAEPHAGADQIRVAVKAVGVNPVDWKIRRA